MGIVKQLKNAIKTWLEIEPAQDKGAVTIKEALTHDQTVLRNRIWYRGDANELDQFFKKFIDPVGRSRFWATISDNPIRKIHVDIPSQIVSRLTDIVASDFDGFEIPDESTNELWEEIAEDNKFQELLKQSISETLVTGDGAFKIGFDPDVSKYPIIEFYGADYVEYMYNRGRNVGTIFSHVFRNDFGTFVRKEFYTDGQIETKMYRLEDGVEKETDLIKVETPLVTWSGGRLDIPLMFDKSTLYEGRGESLLSSKNDAFDALDEVVSEWWDDYRKGRVKQFFPEDMFQRDPKTGEIMRPKEFDDIFVATKSTMSEDGKQPGLFTYAPALRTESYASGFANALDMCLQGLISPATLGIDLKKTDNAEAQREKEKATMYTRSGIIDHLTEALPALVVSCLLAYDNMYNTTHNTDDITVKFGEYASPTFTETITSLVPAVQWKMMSVETMVDELWGDSKDDKWKAEEIERIKALSSYSSDMLDPMKLYEVQDENSNDQSENLPDERSTVQSDLPNGWSSTAK
jgi:hypothetical protein